MRADPPDLALWYAERAAQAAEAANISPGALRALRIHGSGIFLAEADGCVIRVTPRTPEQPSRALTAVATTAALHRDGFPCIRPVLDAPVLLEDAVATFWEYYPQPENRPTAPVIVLADLLKELHRWKGSVPGLPEVRPLARLQAALVIDAAREQPALTDTERSWLEDEVADVAAAWGTIDSTLGRGLIHNDAHRNNLLSAGGGRYVLTDWDGAALGPREIDLIQEGAPSGRFLVDEATRARFCARYGFDLRSWPGCDVLRAARELHSLAAYIRLARDKPAASQELHERLIDLRDGRTRTWKVVR
jgi:hypothetical protein